MPHLYIHLGLHKTGTTALQKNLFPFLKGDLEYIGRPYYSETHFLETLCWGRARKLLISSETIPGRLSDAYHPKRNYLEMQLAGYERLASFVPYASIIIGVRPHLSWIESIYKHYLKYGGALDIVEFLSFDNSSLMSPNEFQIAPRIKRLKELFDGRLLVYDATDLARQGNKVAKAIATFTQTEFSGEMKTARENVGVNQRQAGWLKLVNATPFLKQDPITGRELRRFSIVKTLVKGESVPLKLNGDLARNIINYYADDWRYLFNHLV